MRKRRSGTVEQEELSWETTTDSLIINDNTAVVGQQRFGLIPVADRYGRWGVPDRNGPFA